MQHCYVLIVEKSSSLKILNSNLPRSVRTRLVGKENFHDVDTATISSCSLCVSTVRPASQPAWLAWGDYHDHPLPWCVRAAGGEVEV
ncbi:hypothetical protein Mapa_011454 [Marchantia paleacea]|nr:hypothetical protein Mapa_011454 [Marchantia paleacea]